MDLSLIYPLSYFLFCTDSFYNVINSKEEIQPMILNDAVIKGLCEKDQANSTVTFSDTSKHNLRFKTKDGKPMMIFHAFK